MILGSGEIRTALEQGVIVIDPAPEAIQYSSTSVDLRMGDVFQRWDSDRINHIRSLGMDNTVDAAKLESYSELTRQYMVLAETDSEGCHTIHPGDFVLGITYESVVLPSESGIAARVEGRSTLARMGLAVHLTAPTIHAGWRGRIALEMVNLGPWPIKLRPYELRICQLIFERVGESGNGGPASQFQGQKSPGGS